MWVIVMRIYVYRGQARVRGGTGCWALKGKEVKRGEESKGVKYGIQGKIVKVLFCKLEIENQRIVKLDI